MSWQLKLANWLSKGLLDKYKQQAQIAQTKLQKTQPEIDSLNANLQQTQKQLQQAKAQLQIQRGFQTELGETQLKLQKITAEFKLNQQKWQAAQTELQQLKSQLQQTTQELATTQDWIQQIQNPVEVSEIKKILSKSDFDSLWGFGLGNPKPNTLADAGSIIIQGWVLGKKSAVQTVRITSQDTILNEIEVNRPRPAITQQYPDIPNAANSGFECSISVAGIPPKTELHLIAVLKDDSLIPLCAICLDSVVSNQESVLEESPEEASKNT